jgi:hypothetical protein
VTQDPRPPNDRAPSANKTSPNVDMLRDDIDRGGEGDKVNYPDPATAPLGTDAEAGGNPATPAEKRVAASDQAHNKRKPKFGTKFDDPRLGRLFLPTALLAVVILLGLWALL